MQDTLNELLEGLKMKISVSLSAGVTLDFEDHDKSAAPIFHYGVRDGVRVFFNNNFLLRAEGPVSKTFSIHHRADLMKNRSFEPLGTLDLAQNRVYKIELLPIWAGMGIAEELVVSLLKTFNEPLALSRHSCLQSVRNNLGVDEYLWLDNLSELEIRAVSCRTKERVSNSWSV